MNTPELPEHMELCAAAAAGSIDPVDRQKFAEHLAEGCDDCDATLPAYERATVLLAAALPLSAPAPGVRDRVLQVASGVAPMPTIVAFPVGGNAPRAAQSKSRQSAGPAFEFKTPPGIWAAVSGVFVFAAIASAAVAWHYYGEFKHLHEDIASGTEVISGLNQQLSDAQLWGELYTLPQTRTVRLESTPRADAVLRARAIYDPSSQRAEFVFSDLRMQQGKSYQLWAIEPSRQTSLGLIKTDSDGRAVVRINKAGDANRITDFGVSLEAAGGPAKTPSPLIMVGRIQG